MKNLLESGAEYLNNINLSKKTLGECLDLYEQGLISFRKNLALKENPQASTDLDNFFRDIVGPAFNNLYVVGWYPNSGEIKNISNLDERVMSINETWKYLFLKKITHTNKYNFPMPPSILYLDMQELLMKELGNTASTHKEFYETEPF